MQLQKSEHNLCKRTNRLCNALQSLAQLQTFLRCRLVSDKFRHTTKEWCASSCNVVFSAGEDKGDGHRIRRLLVDSHRNSRYKGGGILIHDNLSRYGWRSSENQKKTKSGLIYQYKSVPHDLHGIGGIIDDKLDTVEKSRGIARSKVAEHAHIVDTRAFCNATRFRSDRAYKDPWRSK